MSERHSRRTVSQAGSSSPGSQPDVWPGVGIQWATILFLTFVFILATVSLDGLFWKEAQPSILEARLEAIQSGMLTRRIGLMALGVVATVGLLRTRFDGIRGRGLQSALLGITLLLVLSSVVWADEPSLVLRKVVIQALLWTGALWAAARLTSGSLVHLALVGTLVTISLGIVVEVVNGVFTPWASDYRLMGFVHPNQTGEYAGFAVLAAVSLALHSRERTLSYLFSATVAFALLILTRSRTALLATTVALLVLLWLATSRSPKGRAIPFAGLAAAAGLLCMAQILGFAPLHEVVPQLLSSGRGDSDLATLTGRTPLWSELTTRYIAERPLLGYGFEGFWTSSHIVDLSLLRPGHAYFHSHSGYIEMALGIGIPGALCCMIAILLCLHDAHGDYRRLPSTDNAMALAALVYVVISMSTEASLFSVGLSSFIVMVCLARQSFAAHHGTMVKQAATVRPAPTAYGHSVERALRR